MMRYRSKGDIDTLVPKYGQHMVSELIVSALHYYWTYDDVYIESGIDATPRREN